MKIKNLLYSGAVELIFESWKHKYTCEGEEVPSVTHVLGVINKPQLVSWASNTAVEYIAEQIKPGIPLDEVQLAAIWDGAKRSPYQKKKDAGTLGTLTHKWVEQYIKGENPEVPVNEGMRESVEQFMEWVEKYKVKFLASEQMIYSRKYKYTGTLDFICKIDGKLYIGDLKTSKNIYSEYYMQTSAYRFARTEEFPKEKYVGQIIIRVGKDGEFERGILKNDALYKRMFDGFLAAMKLSDTLKKLEDFKPGR